MPLCGWRAPRRLRMSVRASSDVSGRFYSRQGHGARLELSDFLCVTKPSLKLINRVLGHSFFYKLHHNAPT
jgi:hypothetical protein